MRILKVIHGYPMRFNAGSEVYSQMLCQGLADKHEVHVFTREEDAFKQDCELHKETDPSDPRILLHIINQRKNAINYQHTKVDEKFADLLTNLQPDIIHIGHLNHLSTSILKTAASQNIPIVYTLHDYWLMCPRGQFIQRCSTPSWQLCKGQADDKCAVQCYSNFFSGNNVQEKEDIKYWTGWVKNRMAHIREMTTYVDQFIAPSHYLLNRYKNELGIDKNKLIYLDYGFDHKRLQGRVRAKDNEPFTFGYIGTHIPAKGIQDLIRAFGQLDIDCRLRIWGRQREDTAALKDITSALPPHVQERIEWWPEYNNDQIVNQVFNHVDAIVVPSIWVENSPLVIHEALQLRIPVITADMGGMSEYVHHEVNGLLFAPRDIKSLAQQMKRLASNPEWALRLGERGYIQSENGDVPEIKQHIEAVENIYHQVLSARAKKVAKKSGPWRITFDTNPDHCNFKCIMCECFSPYSDVKKERVKAGLPRREMSIELIKKVLAEAKGTPLREIIPSTMGEPLLYRDFEQIIELCKEYNIKLNLTTNGSFPRKSAEEWAKLLVPVCSDIKISWNGASKQTQETIMLGSHWERGLKNLETLIDTRDQHAQAGGNRCQITLQLTFLGTNVEELVDIVKLGITLGVDRIKGHHLWAHFSEIQSLSMRSSSQAIEKWNKAAGQAQEVAAQHLLANGKHIILENIFPLEEQASINLAPDGICPFLGKEAWVDTTGRFNPCCAPDQQRRALGEFGNLNHSTMEEIWQSSEYQVLRKNYMNHPLCVSCNMRKPLNVTKLNAEPNP